jgi:hypothetical protein
MRRVLILNVLLLAIIAGLVVQIVSLWWRAEAEVETIVPRETKAQHPELPPAPHRPPAPDLTNHIAEKDLFDASRSAEKAPTMTASEAPPPPPLTLALLGVTVAAGAREALFKDQSLPKPLWLREGEEFNGYKISRIDPTSVVLTAPSGGEVTLVISVEKGAHPGAAAPGPAGIQPTPPPPPPQAGRGRPMAPPPRPGATPNDIKERIERLREEARKRRQRQ